MNEAVVSLLVESTLSFARLLVQCAQPREAMRVLTETAPVAALGHPSVIAMAQSLAKQIDQAYSDEAYLTRYGAYANGGTTDEPFSDVGLMRLFRAQATVEFAKQLQPKRYLSIGGGEGSVPKAVLEATQAHVDLSELLGVGGVVAKALADLAPGRVGVVGRFDVGRRLKHPNWDMVECLEVVEHVVDDLLFLKNIRYSMVDGGTLLLSTPNSTDWIESVHLAKFGDDNWYHHLTAYTPLSLATVLRQAGFIPTIYYVDRCLYAVAKAGVSNDDPYVETKVITDPNEFSTMTERDLRIETGFTLNAQIAGREARLVCLNGNVLV